MRFKIGYAHTGREIFVSKSIGLAYSWKGIYVSNLKLAVQVLCLYGPRKSKPRLKSELCKQQYTVTLFEFNHWAHVIVLWQMQKCMCYCTVFALSYFEPEGNFRVQAPGGVYLERRFIGGFLFGGGGAYIWRGLFFEFYGIWQ